MILLLIGCMTRYNLVRSEEVSLPGMYLTNPAERTDYCEVGYAYAEGFTSEEAKLGLYRYIADGVAFAVVDVHYGSAVVSGHATLNPSGVPIAMVYTAEGVLINWGVCR